MEFAEIITFPAQKRDVNKKRIRSKCPCRCALIKTDLLRHALAFLSEGELGFIEEELRRLRLASSTNVSGETSEP